MKPYRLLVDWEVIEQLNRLPIRVRRALRSDILQLREFPDAMSEFEEKDDTGRTLNGVIRCGIAILYCDRFCGSPCEGAGDEACGLNRAVWMIPYSEIKRICSEDEDWLVGALGRARTRASARAYKS